MALTLITFTPGTKIQSSEVNSNFTDINAELFDISNDNIAVAAAIVDTKLATIATAGKVNGSALVAQTIDAVIGQLFWYVDGALAEDTNVSAEIQIAAAVTVTGVVRARAKIGPVGDVLQFDVMKNGTTIFSTKPEIDDGSQDEDGNQVLTASPTTFAAGDLIRLDILTIGSTTPGSGLSVGLVIEQKVPQ